MTKRERIKYALRAGRRDVSAIAQSARCSEIYVYVVARKIGMPEGWATSSCRLIAWNDKEIAVLRRMWAAGKLTRETSEVLGYSRNAVIGKANRLHLAPRPSPIKTAA
jgi:hypothetical protein